MNDNMDNNSYTKTDERSEDCREKENEDTGFSTEGAEPNAGENEADPDSGEVEELDNFEKGVYNLSSSGMCEIPFVIQYFHHL